MLGTNEHAFKHTKESKFSHYDGDILEVAKLAEAHWATAKQGYRKGVMEVIVPPEGFYCEVARVAPAITVLSVERGEDAFIQIQTTVVVSMKQKARFVTLIFYHKDLLDGKGSEWQLVTILALNREDYAADGYGS